jgi:hypothetical protein
VSQSRVRRESVNRAIRLVFKMICDVAAFLSLKRLSVYFNRGDVSLRRTFFNSDNWVFLGAFLKNKLLRFSFRVSNCFMRSANLKRQIIV